MASLPEYWVDVLPLVAWVQLLVDTHNSLGHYEWNKLLSALHRSYWCPDIYVDIAYCI